MNAITGICSTSIEDKMADYTQVEITLRTKLYDTRVDFNVPILIFPFKYVPTFHLPLHMAYLSFS